MLTFIGHCGLEFKVYRTETGYWAWMDQDNWGFTSDSLQFVLEYLVETKGVKRSDAVAIQEQQA